MWFPMVMLCLTATQMLCSEPSASVCEDRDAWSYREFHTDPPNWGKNFPLCRKDGNAQQTPININSRKIIRKESFNIRHNYWLPAKPNTFYTVQNEGRTIKMDLGETDYYLEVGCKRYKPLQVHIHFDRSGGSEHGVNGRKYPAEIHIVHQRVDAENLLVVGAFVDTIHRRYSRYRSHSRRRSYATSSGLQKMFSGLSAINNPFDEVKNKINAFPLYELLPYGGNGNKINRRFELVNYVGSLTTPGCNGDVDWYVITGATLRISQQLLDELVATKDCYGKSLRGNFRPFQKVQPYTQLFGTYDRL